VIIRPAGERLHFITQPDHAHLSRRVMEACSALADNPRRPVILRAIGEHDNGWAEVDAAPIVDPATGEPSDFVTAPAPVRQAVWPRGVGRLSSEPWAAALVAQHAITVYDRYRPDPAWTTFFGRMEALRDAMVRASGGRSDDLSQDYEYVRLGDLLSLAFCTGWSEELRFAEWSVVGSGTRISVSPDPFDGAVVPMQVSARDLPRGPYAGDSELRAEFARADAVVLHGTVAGR
jgi:hypothetical protein